MQALAGKVAVITGAASGIGRGLAAHAAFLGMRLVLADKQEQPLAALVEELQARRIDCLGVSVDVAELASVQALADASFAHFGQVDLLFNNAGILRSGLSWEVSPEDWRQQLEVNFMGVVHGVHSFVPRLLEQGGPAHIINTASIAAFLASPLMGPYTVSKQAVLAFTETLSYELQMLQAQIGVSLLCPGPVVSAIAESDAVAVPGSPQDQLQTGLRQGIEAGMTAAECAGIVFEAIAENRFWIFPHPEFLPTWESAVNDVKMGKNPIYQAFEME